jgi:uncharacterized membrane protein
MKKLIQIIFSVILAFIMLPLTAFAVSELDYNEKALIEKLGTELNLNGNIISLPDEYRNMVENYFLNNDVSVSENVFNQISEHIDKLLI